MRKEKHKRVTLSNEEAIENFGGTVYRVALDISKHEADAQDVFQEVFLRYIKYRRVHAFNSMEHAKAWFIRVTINCCRDLFTKRSKKQKFETDDSALRTVPSVEKKEANYDVLEAVQGLRENYRIVIHLFYYEGYKIREIADLLDENENTVKTRLSRAKKELEQKLGKYKGRR